MMVQLFPAMMVQLLKKLGTAAGSAGAEAGAGPEPEAELQAGMSADGGFCLSAEEVQRHKDEIEDPAAESSTHEQLAAKDAEIAENHREIAELRRQRADRTE